MQYYIIKRFYNGKMIYDTGQNMGAVGTASENTILVIQADGYELAKCEQDRKQRNKSDQFFNHRNTMPDLWMYAE